MSSKPLVCASTSASESDDIFTRLQKTFGLRARPSQMELAQIVKSTFTAPSGGFAPVCCVEAPTGTGKTLGYLIGALESQRLAAKPLPIVVATATVSLQSQIMRDDIPRLAKIGALDEKKVVLAKGRGRYFCPHTAQLLEDKKLQNSQLDMFEDTKAQAQKGVVISLEMLRAWKSKEWDGDKDSWSGELPDCWDTYCGASSDTCVNRACEYREACPYFKSRAQMSHAQVIVANHDLVIADLLQRANESESTVIPVKKYCLVVDEAHNLPEKAVSTRRAQAQLTNSEWLRDLGPYGESCLSMPDVVQALKRADAIPADVFGAHSAMLLNDLQQFATALYTKMKFDASGVYTWGLRQPGPKCLAQAAALATQLAGLSRALDKVAKFFTDRASQAVGVEKSFCLRMVTESFTFLGKANSLHAGLTAFYSEDPMVRWVSRDDKGRISLNTQPLEGADVLREVLWSLDFPVAMVSATLQVAGSFDRFSEKSGLPRHAVVKTLPPVFDYSRGFLHQPHMDTEPGGPGFDLEVVDKVERLFARSDARGLLVLFTSMESLQRTARALSGPIKGALLAQGTAPVPELVKEHKKRVDAGERSVLLGLNSMSEGLDLPGAYCSHVIITRLPFPLPNDPVEVARRDLLGSAWFNKAYLADMLTALIQSCGRLIRRESDFGLISVLDKRLSTRSYSLKAYEALPSFERGSRMAEYEKMVRTKGLRFDRPVPSLTLVSSAPTLEKPPTTSLATKARPHIVVVGKGPLPEPAKVAAPATVTASAGPVSRHAAHRQLATRALSVAGESVTQLSQVYAALQGLVDTDAAMMPGHVFSRSENFFAQVEALHPCVKGPFEQGPHYLSGVGYFALPDNEPCALWGERKLGWAMVVAALIQNGYMDESAPAWVNFLWCRADLLQFATILQDHYDDCHNPLCQQFSLEHCERVLLRGLSKFGVSDFSLVLDQLAAIERKARRLFSKPHQLPNDAVVMNLAQAAFAIQALT